MKKILSTLQLIAFLLILSSGALIAQQETPAEKNEKVIIITKTTDENGNVETEKIVKHNINGIDVYNLNEKELAELAIIKEGNNIFHFNTNDVSNRACLGVMIGQTQTVENIDGEETILTEGTSELGVPILNIIGDSGAEDAGLLKDDIITNINGQSVSSIQDVLEVLEPFAEGGIVTVDYLRDGQTTQVEATLKACANPVVEGIELERELDVDWDEESIKDIEIELKNLEEMQELLDEKVILFNGNKLDDKAIYRIKTDDAPNRACLGVMIRKVETIDNIDGEEVRSTEGDSDEGIKILNVITDSGAEDAGLLKDDIITNINGQSVATIQEVLDIVGQFEEGGVISVEYLRDGQVAQVEAALKACNNRIVIRDIEKNVDVDWSEEEIGDRLIRIEEYEVDGESKRKFVIGKLEDDTENELVEELVVDEVKDVDLRTETSNAFNNNLDLEELDIFPNPTDSKFTLQFSAAPVATEILITDISGKQVYQEELFDFDGRYSKVIDISRAAKGTLLLSVRQGNKIFTEKIILQ